MLPPTVATTRTRILVPLWRHLFHRFFQLHTGNLAPSSKWRSRRLVCTRSASTKTPTAARSMKEKVKKPRLKVRDYWDVETVKNNAGETIWPAPVADMEKARAFIRECAQSNKPTLLVPDKDADGLSSGVIVHRTLTALGLSPSLISTHIVSKGRSIHDASERELISNKYNPTYLIVLDQGSRPSPPLCTNPATKTLILDHHLSDSFPESSLVVSACNYPPVATTSLLTYLLCLPFHPHPSSPQDDSLAYLALLGTHGDLGSTLKWHSPFPNLSPHLKHHTSKAINTAISLLNAPRRTPCYDVLTAWTALLYSTSPADVLGNSPRLHEARAEVNAEVERCTHTPPKFSADGRIAVLRIKSKAQVHPVIATRWAGFLRSKALEVVCVANEGYLEEEGMVNFSCRVARCARERSAAASSAAMEEGGEAGNKGEEVNIIEVLKAAAGLSEDGLVDRLGESFARGHREASGGIVPKEAFEELMRLLRVGEKVEKDKEEDLDGEGEEKRRKRVKVMGEGSPQKNTLGNYFKKA